MDYEERTLYSTWDVSLNQVSGQDAKAAELLRLMAYLDNQDLWYELFQAGVRDEPLWWAEVMKSRARFNRAMSTLHNYSLVESREGSYSLHTCVHDWTLEYLNREFDREVCGIAIHCVAANVAWETEAEYWVKNRRVVAHVRRLEHGRLKESVDWSGVDAGDLRRLGMLYQQQDMYMAAEGMYQRALRGYEAAWGPNHMFTLSTVNNLGGFYASQGRVVEAEMYQRGAARLREGVGTRSYVDNGHGQQSRSSLRRTGQVGGGGGNVPPGAARLREGVGIRSYVDIAHGQQSRSALRRAGQGGRGGADISTGAARIRDGVRARSYVDTGHGQQSGSVLR